MAGRYPLVLVAWEDSARPAPAWHFTDDLPEPKAVECLSVGFLVYSDKTVKMLAPNLGEVGTESEQASGTIRIPTRCVKSMKKLSY